MGSYFDDIEKMYIKFKLVDIMDVPPHLIPAMTMNFRLKFLQEELTELREGYEADDLPAIADALVDLIVVALGTAALHDLPFNELWDEVQRANMDKQVGEGHKARNEYSRVDLVKPQGWRPPAISRILREAGWKKEDDEQDEDDQTGR